MKQKNIDAWIEWVIANPQRISIPIMTHPGIEVIGATVKQAVTDGKIHYEAIKAISEMYDIGATTVIMDLTVEAEAFGAEVRIPENEIPAVIGRLLETEEDIDNLKIPDLTCARVPQYLLANKLVAENIKDKPALSGCVGPFSLAGRLYDMSEMMMLCYSEPEAAEKLLQKCTDFILTYCAELKKMGVDGVVIAEPAAGLLSNEGCHDFSSVYVKQIIDKLQDENFAIILHNCGNTGHCTQAMVAVGAKGYHFGNRAEMSQVIKECPSDILVMGNLDPVSIFKQSSSVQVKEKTLNLLTEMKAYPNFVLSSGCDVPPHVLKENIDAFFESLNTYNNSL